MTFAFFHLPSIFLSPFVSCVTCCVCLVFGFFLLSVLSLSLCCCRMPQFIHCGGELSKMGQDEQRRGGVVWCVRFNWCVRLGVKTAQIVLLARRPALQVHCKQRGGAMREHAIHLRCDTGGCLAEQQALLLETPVQSLHVSCLCQGSCGQAERIAHGRVGDVSELRTQEVSCVSECVCA